MKNVIPITPRCGICKKFYSSKDDNGSGLCVHCRPANSQPLLNHGNELVQPGKFGVTNAQLIPAIKEAIGEEDVENLTLLKSTYLYLFTKAIRYLNKSEQEYIKSHLCD